MLQGYLFLRRRVNRGANVAVINTGEAQVAIQNSIFIILFSHVRNLYFGEPQMKIHSSP